MWWIPLRTASWQCCGIRTVCLILWTYGGGGEKQCPWLLMQSGQDFIFSHLSYLALTSWQLGRGRGNLHNFRAPRKTPIRCVFKGARGKSPRSAESTFQSLRGAPLTFVADHRGKWIGKSHLHCSERREKHPSYGLNVTFCHFIFPQRGKKLQEDQWHINMWSVRKTKQEQVHFHVVKKVLEGFYNRGATRNLSDSLSEPGLGTCQLISPLDYHL